MPLINDPLHPGKHIDPETGIWPMSEWGSACTRGFVSNERFARPGDQVIPRTNRQTTKKVAEARQAQVIPRTNRQTTKKWRKLNRREEQDRVGAF